MSPDAFRDTILKWPFLASPVHLMQCYRGKAYLPTPRHLWKLNEELVNFFNGPGGEWSLCTMPFGHAKTDVASIGFTAWVLLWNPDIRILVAGHSEKFARDQIGAEVKKIVETFGPELGIKLRADSKAKGQWKIDGRIGGMACFGKESRGQGYRAEIYCIDDLIGDLSEALSPGEMEKQWGFFKATVFSRLTLKSKLSIVGTRWGKRDIFGRVMDLARRTKKAYRLIRFPALATEKDIDAATGTDQLGRKVGEPLWPEQVSLDQLKIAQKEFGPYFNAWYQQAPTEEEDSLLQPAKWPVFIDAGHCYWLDKSGVRKVVPKDQAAIMVTVDWAYKEKKKADRTAILVCGLLPDGQIMILHCIAKRFGVEEGPKQLAAVCRDVRPALVGMEGHDAMLLECRRYPDIPEPRQLQHRSKAKIVRAVQAVEMGVAARIYLPADDAPWLDDFKEEVGGFTGVDDDHDDIVDALAYACMLAQQLRGASSACPEPDVLIEAPGRGGLYG